MKNICLITPLLFTFYFAAGQESPMQILERAAQRIGALNTVQYETAFMSKNPFSEGDVSSGKSHVTVAYKKGGLIKAMAEYTEMNEGRTLFRTIFRNDTLHSLNLVDSTYSFSAKEKIEMTSDLTSVRAMINEHFLKDAAKIVRKEDTLINNRLSYSFLIKPYDIVTDGKHDYTHKYLILDRATLMPVYMKEVGEGTASKGGHSLGRLKFFSETYFSAIRVNEPIDDFAFNFNTSGFTPPVENMLADGTRISDLKLKDLSNRDILPSGFKNKVLLLDFASTTCPANPLANPVLSRLHKLYASKGVVIVSIFSDESAEQVKKYLSSNNLEYPAYLGSPKLKKQFRAISTPNFYVINKEGLVVQGIEGYSDDLEQRLSETLQGLTK